MSTAMRIVKVDIRNAKNVCPSQPTSLMGRHDRISKSLDSKTAMVVSKIIYPLEKCRTCGML